MARRTYLPELLKIMRRACKYIGEHDERIRTYLPPEYHNALDAVLLACSTLEAALEIVVGGLE